MALKDKFTAYYKLDESSGNAIDSVGSNTLTNTNSVTYATGLLGNCADGGTGFTTKNLLSTTAALSYTQLGTAFSINFWVNPNASLNGNKHYWGGVTASNGTYNRSVQACFVASTNTIAFDLYDGTQKIFNTGVNPSSGSWYMVTLTYDGTYAKTYVNAVLKSTDSLSWAIGENQNINYTSALGYNKGALNLNVNAKLDEYGFCDETLTQTDIDTLYNAGAGITYPFPGGGSSNFFQLF